MQMISSKITAEDCGKGTFLESHFSKPHLTTVETRIKTAQQS